MKKEKEVKKTENKKYPELLILGILIILNVIINFININKYIENGIILITFIYLIYVWIVYFKKNKQKNIKQNNKL